MDPEAAREVAVPTTYVLAVGLMLAELLLLRVRGHRVDHRGGFTSVVSGALAFGALALAGRLFYAGLLEGAWSHRLLDWPSTTLGWVAAFVLYDLFFYVGHRLGHEVRLLWCFHGVHHTAEEMRLTSAIRGSALDFVYLPWFHAWMPLLGIPPAMLLVVESAARIWAVCTHVSPRLVGRLGPLEGLVVTPSAHRVHHGRQLAYLDRNYGEVLTIWDRLLGTWRAEAEPPSFGLIAPLPDDHLGTVQLTPWRDLWRDVRRAPTAGVALRYLFDAPGWRHDGEDRRVRRLQAEGAAQSR